ncbi:probable protein kinase family protein [Cephalotrichum gorgonifer]|uniref:Probable protein kinase family protein n=1 Tax=Cephalotrichum gorgonifer TaxID=2041049 RepID=A0AAE8MQV6_9PEZI|nr:probable protein kinase family protein [Cephalotrichum gorgonifer]
MDFLKSAVASAIAKGPPFPYSFGEKVDIDESIWTLSNGTKREDGSRCSIFSFDIAANRSRLPLARNALKKLRTLRHPGVIKVLDTVETDSYIYIATERLVPLRWHVKRKSLSPEAIKWGLHSVANTLKFINKDAASIHGSIKVGSIYTSESGEWKLGGFEVLSAVKDDEAIIYTYGSLVPGVNLYYPPELARGGWDAIKKGPHSAVDSFNFGTLIYEAFNSTFTSVDQAGQTTGIPPTMHASYKRLVNANPKARVSVANFLDQGRRSGSFFDVPLIKLTDDIDNLGVKSPGEKEEFLSDLGEQLEDFPEDFLKMKVLPELLKSAEFGGGGPKALEVVMKIAAGLPSDDFDSNVTPVVIRLFGNPDRALRVSLLDNLPLIIERLPQRVVNDKIFPQLVTGFTDLAPLVREQTLKSVLVIVPKLSDRTINGELLRYLAKTANDEQPGIRANTTICLGKIAKHLNSSTRGKVLIAAFSRALRDPFVHARNASLMALAATADHFGDEDSATRILPSVCPSLLDKEQVIRDQASKTVDVYLQKVRKAAESMPASALPPTNTSDGSAAPRMGTPQPAEGGASSWAGWAISSFTNKMSTAAGEIQANGSASPNPTPSPGPAASKASTLASASTLHRQAVTSPPPPISRTASSTGTKAAAMFQDDEDGADDGADAWGDMGDDTFFDDSNDTSPKASAKATSAPSLPYDDGGEPDFSGWLAAQSQKKTGNKPLPKGLAKPKTSTIGAPKTASSVKKAASSRPAVTKKIDMKPKESEVDEDDAWGDGW